MEMRIITYFLSLDLRSKLDNPTPENVNEELPYCTMINRLLPDNIKCYAWSHVGPKTSARFDCSSRCYKYFFPKGNIDIPVSGKVEKQKKCKFCC